MLARDVRVGHRLRPGDGLPLRRRVERRGHRRGPPSTTSSRSSACATRPATSRPRPARSTRPTGCGSSPTPTYTRVPLEPAANPLTGRPLDLSGAMLRSVSPVHLEYLANMGVVSSMSVSLIDRGKLWGLIACHHYAGPHRPSYTDRTAAEFLGRTASLLLHTTVTAGEQGDVVGTAQRLAAGSRARSGCNPRALAGGADRRRRTCSDLLPAGGRGGPDQRPAAAARDDAAGRPGRAAGARRCSTPGCRSPTPPPRVVPAAADLADTASGVLAVEVAGGRDDFLAWFRPGDAARGHLGRQPVRVEDGDDRRRAAAEPAPVVRQLERDGARRPRGRGASTRSPPRGRWPRASPTPRSAAPPRTTGWPPPCSAPCCWRSCRRCPGVALAARYLPTSDDVVGGDWYDIVPLPGGRVSIVLGDVAGHGLAAAAITAQLRHALRAHLLRAAGPACRAATGSTR